MALDGIYLSKIRNEIENRALYSRVDKVSQPSKDEIVLTLRNRNESCKLLLCVRANSPRVHFTAHNLENPAQPPMLCMLFRKFLVGAMIKAVRQYELDRILFIDFDATNEIGDKNLLTLCIEIMGKYSNVILFDENRKIIDSVKRVDFSTSSVRQILPGLIYELPPKQNKVNLIEQNAQEAVKAICENNNQMLSKAVLGALQGVSPIISREIAYLTCADDKYVSELTQTEKDKLLKVIRDLKAQLNKTGKSYMLLDDSQKPFDFSFMPIIQYETKASVREYETYSELLDSFYFEKDRIERTRYKGQELFKLISNLIERASKKLNIQNEEIKNCENKEEYRIFAELINANIYRLEKGSFFYELENYYDNNNIVRIKADPSLTPSKNAQRYYKKYKKAQTAEKMLAELIVKTKEELVYFETVLDELTRSDTESELSSIREELRSLGYIKNKGKNKKTPKALPPHEFFTTDGFRVLVGRNNIQNDYLSMKFANNHDMFLHIQKQPGSHVIIVSDNKEISDRAIEEAAVIASYYSSARESSLVPIDYTYVKNLKKPLGAKPGFVIYHTHYTITVKPDAALVEELRKK